MVECGENVGEITKSSRHGEGSTVQKEVKEEI